MTTTSARAPGSPTGSTATPDGVEHAGSMDGETYEQWVAGIDIDTGRKKGRVREDANALRFVEVTVNGPKTWSLAAALHPEISAALDAAQDKAAAEIVGWVAQHATTRVGPRGRQVQVPVEQIEAAVIRHYTSRAGDPHRHLHLQINARVWAAGALAGHPLGRDPGHDRGDQRDRARRGRDRPGVPGGARRARVHPRPRDRARSASSRRTSGRSAPGPRRSAATSTATKPTWRRRASRRGAGSAAARGVGPAGVGRSPARQGRPAPTAPSWWRAGTHELRDLGYRDPADASRALRRPRPGWIDRDAAADWSSPSSGRSGRPGTPPTSAARSRSCSPRPACRRPSRRGSSSPKTSPPAPPPGASGCSQRTDVPEHVRSLTSPQVLEVEADLDRPPRPPRRAARPPGPHRRARAGPGRPHPGRRRRRPGRRRRHWWWSKAPPVPGRPPRCGRRRQLLARQGHRLVVVTPTLKAAEVAAAETGADGHSAAWLIHQHGWRWDDDGHWTRQPDPTPDPARTAATG